MALEDEAQLLERRAAEIGDQVQELERRLTGLRAEQARLTRAAQVLRGSELAPGDAARREHTGKYRPLWQWLKAQQPDVLVMTFADIERVLGFHLPPSSRRHASHWHGYEGSAVARAIRDAGFRARNLDLASEIVELHRVGQREPGPDGAGERYRQGSDEGDVR